jgi:phosphohistidine phosphatase
LPGQARTLLLLRHAKSSWDDPGLPDADRPLAPRGRRAAAAMAGRLRAIGGEPGLTLCSPARRARETAELLGLSAAPVLEPALYGGAARAVVERLRRVPDHIDALLVIGHNPELQALALELAREGPLRRELAAGYPTGALAALRHGGTWSELRWGSCELVEFVRPRELG